MEKDGRSNDGWLDGGEGDAVAVVSEKDRWRLGVLDCLMMKRSKLDWREVSPGEGGKWYLETKGSGTWRRM